MIDYKKTVCNGIVFNMHNLNFSIEKIIVQMTSDNNGKPLSLTDGCTMIEIPLEDVADIIQPVEDKDD